MTWRPDPTQPSCRRFETQIHHVRQKDTFIVYIRYLEQSINQSINPRISCIMAHKK